MDEETKFDAEVRRRHFWRNYDRVMALPRVTLDETLEHIRTAFKGQRRQGAVWNDVPYKTYRAFRLVNPGFGMPVTMEW